jgi:O-antigen/teichoic acid export membrane protein
MLSQKKKIVSFIKVNKSLVHKLFLFPQLKIGIAVGISGLSQAILVLVPALSLDAKDASDLVLWQSLSAGVGILLSSILGVFTFSRIVSTSIEDDEGTPDYASLLPNFMYLFTMVLLILLPIAFSLFEEERIFLTLFLAISLFGFLLMAVQRNYYAAVADWNAVSFQFGIDGLIRLTLTVLIVIYFESSVIVLILASVLSQFLSIGIPSLISPWWMGFRKSNKKFHLFVLEISPLVFTTLGSLTFTTFPPVFLKAIATPFELVTALGVVMILFRIPSTILNPLLIPQVREITQYHLKGLFDSEFRLFSKTTLRIFFVAVPTATTISLLAANIIDLGGNNSAIYQFGSLTKLLVILIGTSFVVEGFANSCINSQGRFRESGIAYLTTSCILLSTLFVAGTSINSVLESLLLASSLAFVWLYIRIFIGSRVANSA